MASKPGILMGDFNELPAIPGSQPLQKAYTDGWAESVHPRGDRATYPAESPTVRIDLIYATRKVAPLVTQVLNGDPTASGPLPAHIAHIPTRSLRRVLLPDPVRRCRRGVPGPRCAPWPSFRHFGSAVTGGAPTRSLVTWRQPGRGVGCHSRRSL
ncbi:hypothetical protein [Streptomyces sp. 049-1]|uniref:hypothetical protein n=1 Tax=Streptomyces sp. 049-1 TaxID=2789264 RepID=UPI00397F9E86